VDDEHSIADTLALILQSAGFEAKAVYTGEDAIAAVPLFLPDVLIADHHMPPGMSGIEAAVAIKKMMPGCHILMLSGQSLTQPFSPYAAKGYNFLLLSKPIHPQALLDTIHGESTGAIDLVAPVVVLNVDDREAQRYSLSRALALAGFDVSEAKNGIEAIRQCIDLKPDLVLLDIRLPDINGFDVCRALKENSETGSISVLHITAADRNQDDQIRSAEVGADDYVTHPIAPKQLAHRIRELVQLKYLQ
jgi:DNA-binding response OmpR family regulator